MTLKDIEKLIRNDRHGIYVKLDRSIVILPVRRHRDWLAKGMELIAEANSADSKEVQKKVEQKNKEKQHRAKELLEKYGEAISEDLPELFAKDNKKESKRKSAKASNP